MLLRCLFVLAVWLPSLSANAEQKQPSFDQRLTGYAYPFETKTFAFESQNQQLEMVYMHLPAKGDAPTALLLHGKNFNGAYWKSTADHLAKRGWGVVIPDQIGFGKSSKPTNYQYSFHQLARNTRDLLQSLAIDQVAVVGHSMGGMLAARFALAYPEMSRRLILINPIGLEDYLDYTTYTTIDDAYAREKSLTADNIVAYQKKNYYAGDWNDTYEALTLPLRGWISGPDKDQIAYVSALTYDMILTQPVVDDFAKLALPTTLILGTRDRTAPNRANMKVGETRDLGRYDRLGAEMEKLIPNLHLIELDDLGHLPQIENFDRFSKAFSQALER